MVIAEELLYSDYSEIKEKQSKIDPSKIIREEVGMNCPSCDRLNRPIEHQEIVECKCGLKMQRMGNNLRCIKGDVPQHLFESV